MNRRFLSSLLLAVALFDAVASFGFWFAKGANTGWTKNQVEVISVDEVTGLEVRQWESRFVPGVEMLGICLLGAAVIGTLALLFRKQETNNTKT